MESIQSKFEQAIENSKEFINDDIGCEISSELASLNVTIIHLQEMLDEYKFIQKYSSDAGFIKARIFEIEQQLKKLKA